MRGRHEQTKNEWIEGSMVWEGCTKSRIILGMGKFSIPFFKKKGLEN
jgi:hypothetical protein